MKNGYLILGALAAFGLPGHTQALAIEKDVTTSLSAVSSSPGAGDLYSFNCQIEGQNVYLSYDTQAQASDARNGIVFAGYFCSEICSD